MYDEQPFEKRIRTKAIRTKHIRTKAIRTKLIRTNVLRTNHPPDGSGFHEGEAALHEEDNDGHDEQEKVVHFFRNFVAGRMRPAVSGRVVVEDNLLLISRSVVKRLALKWG
jgi:hypothetical protein